MTRKPQDSDDAAERYLRRLATDPSIAQRLDSDDEIATPTPPTPPTPKPPAAGTARRGQRRWTERIFGWLRRD